MRNDHKFTNTVGVMIQRGFNKKYIPNLWEVSFGFLWQLNAFGHTGIELRGWELSEEDAEGLRLLGLRRKRQRSEGAGLSANRTILRDPCVLIMCCLRLYGGESKRCGDVFTYQKPT